MSVKQLEIGKRKRNQRKTESWRDEHLQKSLTGSLVWHWINTEVVSINKKNRKNYRYSIIKIIPSVCARIGTCWYLLVCIGTSLYILVRFSICWHVLLLIGTSWYVPISIGTYSYKLGILVCLDTCWYVLYKIIRPLNCSMVLYHPNIHIRNTESHTIIMKKQFPFIKIVLSLMMWWYDINCSIKY